MIKINDSNKYLEINTNDYTHTGRILLVEQDKKHDLRDFVRFGDRLSHDGQWPNEGFIAYYINGNSSKREQKHMAS